MPCRPAPRAIGTASSPCGCRATSSTTRRAARSPSDFAGVRPAHGSSPGTMALKGRARLRPEAAGSARCHRADCPWQPRRRTRRSWGLGVAPKTHNPQTHAPDAGRRSAARSGAALGCREPPPPERARGRGKGKGPGARRPGDALPHAPFALSGASLAAGPSDRARAAAPGGPPALARQIGIADSEQLRLALAAPSSAAASGGPRGLCQAAPREGPGGNEGGTGRGRRD